MLNRLQSYLRPLRRSPFGWRLVGSYALLFVGSTALLILLVYVLLQTFLRDQDQAMVRAQADAYATVYTSGGLSALRTEVESAGMDTELLVRLLNADGTAKYQFNTTDLGSSELRVLENSDLQSEDGWLRVYEDDELTEEDDDAVEIISRRLSTGERLQFGLSTEPRGEVLESFQWVLLAIVLPTVGLALGGGTILALRALRPVRRLIDTADTIVETGDVSQRVPVEAERGEFAELARLVNHMLGRIDALIERLRDTLDDAAHDLRTPLTRLRGRAEQGLRSSAPAERRDALADVIDAADRMETMLDTILTVAEAESGAAALTPTSTSLRALVEEVVSLYEMVAEERGLTLTTDVQEATVVLDPDRMRQALANVVDNALKYTPKGGHVTVEARATASETRVRVQDTGIGIPPADQPHIWDRLYRGDASRSTEGLGLGLSLVRAVVEAHGGEVAVESEPEHGTTITLRLPQRDTA
jgi:signal transduction histidine kinase